MVRRKIKKLLALTMICMVLTGSLWAAGARDQRSEGPVTLKVFSMPMNGSGIQNDPLANYMRDNLGIIVEWLPAAGDMANQRLQAMLAAGELPDLICFHTDRTPVLQAIEAGLLLPLDKYLDRMPNVAKNGDKSLAFFADTLGDGTSYVIGQGIANSVFTGYTNYSINLRWDLYKQIGMPPITTLDDIIPILSEMQKLEPRTPDGRRTYGFSFWPDWDGSAIFMASEYTSMYGVETWDGYAEYNAATGEIINQLSDASWYKKGLEFFFNMNQAGLLDPDSLTQRFDNARAKYQDGRAMMSFHGWVSDRYNTATAPEGGTNRDHGRGFVPLFNKDAKVLVDQSSPTGVYPWAISANTKNLDAALKFLDFWFSVEAASIIYNGFEGESWNIVDGQPMLTEKGLQELDDGTHAKVYGFYTHPGLNSGFYNERTGTAIGKMFWDQIVNRHPTCPVRIDYFETKGINNPFDGFDPQENTAIRIAWGLRPTLDDDIQIIVSRIAPIVKTASWQMVFAKDKAEFERIWKDMQVKAEGLGLQKAYEAGRANTIRTLELTEKYGDPTVIGINK